MEETLLELVREYEELYDMANKKYSDASHKDRIWTRIALELDKTVPECKQRWTSLRDQYRKYLRRVATCARNGQEITSKAKFKYAKQISFVKPFLRDIEKVTNLEDRDYADTEEGEDTDVDYVLPQKRKKRWSEEDQPLIGENYSEQESRNEIKKLVCTPSSDLVKCLVENNIKEENCGESVDLFFQSIAATVKGFTPYYQNLCKSKVLSVVSNLEMAQILGKFSPGTTSIPPPPSITPVIPQSGNTPAPATPPPGNTTAPTTPQTTNTVTSAPSSSCSQNSTETVDAKLLV